MTPREVLDQLAAIGGAAEIAEFLQREGVTGKREDSHGCPVAVYVERQTGAEMSVYVPVWESGDEPDREGGLLPPTVEDFVIAFDEGKFPELAATA